MVQRANALGFVNRTKATPIPVNRTTRNIQTRALTSLPAGKMVPLVALPLLREDNVVRAEYRLAFEMSETVELLMNAVSVRVMAYVVPRLAFERFGGSLDHLNKSYEGLPLVDGGAVTPWFQPYTIPADYRTKDAIMVHLGVHARPGQVGNTDYMEAYNAIWNLRASNRSKDIVLRSQFNTTLAPAFWNHQTFAHIVPDFDQAVIDGEVALNVIVPTGAQYADVINRGSWPHWGSYVAGQGGTVPATGGLQIRSDGVLTSSNSAEPVALSVGAGLAADVGAVFQEMMEAGVTISLSNIELARKTQAFAALRRSYAGHSDEYIIDLLMDGISVPEEVWKKPVLLADVSTVFGMSKRYASDGENLTESVVNGVTYVDLRFSCPRVPSGGVIMIVAEIAPEQLFERQKDPYFHARNVDDLPQFLRDTLDPEKVSVVTNEEIDIDHSAPTGTFGYAPLNHQWAKSRPTIGGKFYRPEVDAEFDEDRQRIWAVETANPRLSQDFYLVSGMHYKPFVVTDTAIDPFECLTRGGAMIRGNTVFGGLLVEAEDDYAEVLEEAPLDRIDKPAAAARPVDTGTRDDEGE